MGSAGKTADQGGTMLAGLHVTLCLLSLPSLLCSSLQILTSRQSETVSRPLVDPDQELTILESCSGVADGTRCTKRCVDWSCDPAMARCYQGRCKRSGHHPCV